MVRCTDCKHFDHDIDDYPICLKHDVMVSGAGIDSETSACYRLDGVDLFEPKDDLEKDWVIDERDPFKIKVHKDCIGCEHFHNGCTRVNIRKFGGNCAKHEAKE